MRLAHAVAARALHERLGELGAEAVAALAVGDADHLQPRLGIAAAELALEHPAEDEAGDRAFRLCRELQVLLGGRRRGGEPALEVRAPRPAAQPGVDRRDGGEVLRREAADHAKA